MCQARAARLEPKTFYIPGIVPLLWSISRRVLDEQMHEPREVAQESVVKSRLSIERRVLHEQMHEHRWRRMESSYSLVLFRVLSL